MIPLHRDLACRDGCLQRAPSEHHENIGLGLTPEAHVHLRLPGRCHTGPSGHRPQDRPDSVSHAQTSGALPRYRGSRIPPTLPRARAAVFTEESRQTRLHALARFTDHPAARAVSEHALVRQGPRVMSAFPQCGPHAYWITSVAWNRSVGAIVRPSAFAVLRLITRSNFIGCSTGNSAGFAPLRILSTKAAARR